MTTRMDKFVTTYWGNYDELFLEAEEFFGTSDVNVVMRYLEKHVCCVDSLLNAKDTFDVYGEPDDKDKVCHRIKNSLIRDCKLCWEEQLIDDG